ncbi:MAG: hypothetical protein LBK00_02655 [Treponema sp.]|jgi:hypothetical protein|nr:hypothetical protein [Treponema sp.]
MKNKRFFVLILVLGFVSSTVFAQTLTDASARRRLSNVGITVNASAPQTSLEGIREATLLEIVWLSSRVNARNIVITGGTESTGGHNSGTYSHGNGYKVDLRFNSTLDSYIENNFTRDGSVDGYPAYRSPNGGLYVKERDHWDVLVR